MAKSAHGSSSDKDEESRLERILDVVLVVKQTTTGPRDHRAVATNDGGEGRFVPLFDEPLEQQHILWGIVVQLQRAR